ncbi:hypothetical protein ncot_16615 [Nocardioides sp. JQ2195]|uniref:hypothetical protein n=1 Tax=Nocardioides sp. JQ2195 TaxID=2592334 RepID=UPI00143E96C2|nr:hypothetical protein [Nocardioides sp. JQ2195]QIX28032.1 hypothetical protein ncot_16615 [Nocardioides sp. JQ2195]
MTSTTARPRVILHVGIPKTGTSALQVAFVRDRELLAQHGIIYPSDPAVPSMDARATRGGVTSGNASLLRAFLMPGKTPRGTSPEEALATAMTVIRDAGDGSSSLLFSSEFLCRSDLGRFATFVAACDEIGYDVEVVGYVRNVVGHAVSQYIQRLKRHRFTGSFADFVEPSEGDTYKPPMRSWIEGMGAVLGPSAVTVVHYDSLRNDLVRHFFDEYLKVPAENLAPALEHTVNRSLTPDEVRLMREINKRLKTAGASRQVSDVVISANPSVPERPYLTRADRDRVVELFTDEVDWINANGILGGKLELDSPSITILDEDPDDTAITPSERTLVDVIATQANRAVSLQAKAKQSARKAKRAAARKTPAAAAAPKAAPERRRSLFRRK